MVKAELLIQAALERLAQAEINTQMLLIWELITEEEAKGILTIIDNAKERLITQQFKQP